jgi:DNA mismatch repair protein MutS
VANVHVAAEERDGDVTFLRTVQDGPTDRSYGIHVADLAGVPEPVVSRAGDVLERLRAEKAIEARGGGSDGPVQAVFDLSSGQFSSGATGGESVDAEQSPAGESENGTAAVQQTRRAANGGTEAVGGADAGDDEASIDPELAAVVDELRETDVNSQSPLEVVQRVQEWQERLAEDE